MFESWFPKEWSTIKKIIWLKAAQGIGSLVTLTGSIVSFIASKAKAINALTVTLEPIQEGSGDPSPDNVRPITGWTGASVTRTGKNLYFKETDGLSVSASGVVESNNSRNMYFARIESGKKYTFSTGGSVLVGFFSEIPSIGDTTYNNSRIDLNTTSAYTFTAPNGIKYIGASYASSITGQMLVDGETLPDYEAPSVTTLSVTFPDGQTVYYCTYDFVSGEGIAEWKSALFDGSNDEGWDLWGGSFVTYGTTTDIATSNSVSQTNIIVRADRFKANGVNYRGSHGTNGIIKVVGVNSYIAVDPSSYANINEFKASLQSNPMQVLYKLATPIPFTLTPQQISTLVGQNNVFGDGTVSVTIPSNIIVT